MEIIKKWITPGEAFDGAKAVRTAVFVDEQGFSHKEEWDDLDKLSFHLELWQNDCPVACGRLYEKEDGWRLGRIAVLPSHRGTGLGAQVVILLELKATLLGAKRITIASQKTACGFYKKLGFTEIAGTDFMDGHTPHIIMYKDIIEE